MRLSEKAVEVVWEVCQWCGALGPRMPGAPDPWDARTECCGRSKSCGAGGRRGRSRRQFSSFKPSAALGEIFAESPGLLEASCGGGVLILASEGSADLLPVYGPDTVSGLHGGSDLKASSE